MFSENRGEAAAVRIEPRLFLGNGVGDLIKRHEGRSKESSWRLGQAQCLEQRGKDVS